MNIAAVYKDATGKVPEEVKTQRLAQRVEVLGVKQKEEVSWRSWLTHPVTVQFFADIDNQISELDSEARELALNYHNNKNEQAIITTLIKSATLRKVKENANQKASTTVTQS